MLATICWILGVCSLIISFEPLKPTKADVSS